MKYFINKYTPIYNPATILTRPAAYRYLIERQIIESVTDEITQVKTDKGMRNCVFASFDDGVNPKITGFVPAENIEKYEEVFPSWNISIAGQTANLFDGWQYVTYMGKVQYNLCGPFCVSYILGVDPVVLLDGWKAKERKWWETFFNTKYAARGTSDGEILRLSRSFGRRADLLSDIMRFPEWKDVRYTPARLAEALKLGSVIASVYVDPAYHFIKGSGVLHWVVVLEVVADRGYGGYVKFWNSLTGAVELCSWREWVASTRNSPYGIIIYNE